MFSYFLKYVFFYISTISDFFSVIFSIPSTLRGHFLTFGNMPFSHVSNLCFFSKHKLFILVTMTLYKKFCKQVILRGHLVMFLSIILQPSRYCIGHSENEKNLVLRVLRFLVLCKEVMLGGYILNIYKVRFSKLVFHMVLS